MSDKHDLHDERISRLYQAGSTNEPPEHLDSRIIQEAHDASGKRKRRTPWSSLATAAVLVLSISLVLKVLEQEPLEKSVLEPSPQETNGYLAEPMQEKELEEQIAPTDKTDADSTIGTSIGTRSREVEKPTLKSDLKSPPPAVAPAVKSATTVVKPMLKDKAAPAMERYRSQMAAPARATVGKSEVQGFAKGKSRSSSADMLAPELKQQKKRLRLELQKAPGVLQRAPAKTDLRDLCSAIELPATDEISAWRELYSKSIGMNDLTTADCLRREYQSRFGRPLPVKEAR